MTVCARNVSADPIGEPCPNCGHTGMAHPHIGNLVPHCLVCEIIEIIEEART